MNKLLAIILPFSLFLVLSCDTSSNVKPRNADFFFKVYGGITEGNHKASSIIETSDGGLLISGTSTDGDENPLEILLIKTDRSGNVEWVRGYADVFGNSFTSEAKTVLETPSGYVVGGSYDSLGIRHSILFEVNGLDGSPTGAKAIINFPDSLQASYELSNVTVGPSGLLVAGTTNQVTGDQKGGKNGFITRYNLDLTEVDTALVIKRVIFGLGGNEEICGAFEVSDPQLVGREGSEYLAFGTTDKDGSSNFFYMGFRDDLREATPIRTILDASGSKSASKVIENNGRYWMIGSQDLSSIYMSSWRFTNSDSTDWSEVDGYGKITVDQQQDELGKSMVFSPQGKIIVSDIVFSADHSEIALSSLGGDANLDPGWPVTFGNSSSTYSAADVIVLQDGSIVTLGTADLEPIKKIVVIKTGPNGEMNFE